MTYKVSPQDLSQIKLNESDTVASILQNIAILLSTRQQSIPLYRNFGLPGNFIDKPMGAANNLMVAEIREAIMEFEPRAALRDVTFAVDEGAPGKIIPTVEVEITDE